MDNEIHSIKIRFNAKAKDIVLLNAIIDSYEGLALIRTDDTKERNFMLLTTSHLYEEVLLIINSLETDGIFIENITVEKTDNIDFN